jgi:hypothetical protein
MLFVLVCCVFIPFGHHSILVFIQFGCHSILVVILSEEENSMRESRTLSISINRNWRRVYEAVWQPQYFTRWASGLSQSGLERDGSEWWKAQGPEGPIRIRFSDHNAFGVMDHCVDLGNGVEVYVPMRIIPNAEGAEILFTLFRQPNMSDEKFVADAAWVARDLQALKSLIESSSE